MIEREFIAQKTKEYYIKKYIESKLNRVGVSSIRLKKIPLGEKIIIETSRPSLIVGSKGSNIKELTKTLKRDFKLENPQIEITEIKKIFLDANIVAERIAGSLERFGSQRFKGVGHKVMENVMNSGALGVEIIISGKIPSARARNWRFYQGYLKKCGDVAVHGVKSAKTSALLKSGIVGIKVSIMPPDVILPDHIDILSEPVQIVEEIKDEKKVAKTTKKKSTKKPAKKAVKKPVNKDKSAVKEAVVTVKTEEPKVEVKPEVKEEVKAEETTESKDSEPAPKEQKPVEESPKEEVKEESKEEKKEESKENNTQTETKELPKEEEKVEVKPVEESPKEEVKEESKEEKKEE
jgi:small subunit ribosomal protein S3